MNGTREGSVEIASSVSSAAPFRCEVVIIPPVIYMHALSDVLKKECVLMGAQNVNPFERGAHTGEVSASMISEFGCSYCLVGHSERRMSSQRVRPDAHARDQQNPSKIRSHRQNTQRNSRR